MSSAQAPTPKKVVPTQYGLAAIVAQHVDLATVYMSSVTARLRAPHRVVSESILKNEVEAKLAWSPAFSVQEVPAVLVVRVPFQVMIAGRAENALPLAEVEVELSLEYPLDSLPPGERRDELFEAFAKVNGVYNSWPYLREVVQNTFARMALPPIVLPVYRVTKAKTP